MAEVLSERKQEILEQAINDYIETGEPITSGSLCARHELGIKPAMMRRELGMLNATGFLTQLHTSGGRVPTHKGYAFLIERLRNTPQPNGASRKTAGDVRSLMARGSFEEAVQHLSKELHMVSAVYDTARKLFYDSGLEELCASDAFAGKEDVLGVLRSVELLPSRLARWRRWDEDEWPLVLVGRNDLVESDALSVVADRAEINKQHYCIMVVGPTRMDYGEILKLLKSFSYT